MTGSIDVALMGPDGEPEGHGYDRDVVPMGEETQANFQYDGPAVDVDRAVLYQDGEEIAVKELGQTFTFGRVEEGGLPLTELNAIIRPDDYGT